MNFKELDNRTLEDAMGILLAANADAANSYIIEKLEKELADRGFLYREGRLMTVKEYKEKIKNYN